MKNFTTVMMGLMIILATVSCGKEQGSGPGDVGGNGGNDGGGETKSLLAGTIALEGTYDIISVKEALTIRFEVKDEALTGVETPAGMTVKINKASSEAPIFIDLVGMGIGSKDGKNYIIMVIHRPASQSEICSVNQDGQTVCVPNPNPTPEYNKAEFLTVIKEKEGAVAFYGETQADLGVLTKVE